MKWTTYSGRIVKELNTHWYGLNYKDSVRVQNIVLRAHYRVRFNDVLGLLFGSYPTHNIIIEATPKILDDIQEHSKGSFWLRMLFPQQFMPGDIGPDTYHVIFKNKADAFRCVLKYNARYFEDSTKPQV